MKNIAIIGSGAAGLLLLHNFEKHNISPKQITLFDPTHLGGDLQLQWSSVKSNTVWRQITDAVASSISTQEPFCSLDPEQPCQLRYIISYLLKATESYRAQCQLRTGYVESVEYADAKWKLYMKGQSFLFDIIFCTQGSDCKTLDLPYPSIPLSIALDQSKLQELVKPHDHVLLFGTAHSATLIAKNLLACQALITNFYASEKPFYFDRDGDYDGLKQEAAAIADAILAKQYPSLELVSIQDTSAVIRCSKSAKYCIYAIGFQPRILSNTKAYDAQTGKLHAGPNAWGFGIAYANQAPDGIHYDVSVPAFQNHIQKQMSDILSSLSIE